MSRRGIYRKRGLREEAEKLPAAWIIGDKKSFSAARARAVRSIALDLNLTGREKAALVACLDHMNADERWSCYAAIPLIAKEAGVDKATVWRAIGRADGKHILTKRGRRRSDSGYASTHITLHPVYGVPEKPDSAPEPTSGRYRPKRNHSISAVADRLLAGMCSMDGTVNNENYVAELRPSKSNYVAELQKLDRNPAPTRSQNCEQNLLHLTYFKEPTENPNLDLKGRMKKEAKEKKRHSGKTDEFPKHLARSEANKTVFIRCNTDEWQPYCEDHQSAFGKPMVPDPHYGNVGCWVPVLGWSVGRGATP